MFWYVINSDNMAFNDYHSQWLDKFAIKAFLFALLSIYIIQIYKYLH